MNNMGDEYELFHEHTLDCECNDSEKQIGLIFAMPFCQTMEIEKNGKSYTIS